MDKRECIVRGSRQFCVQFYACIGLSIYMFGLQNRPWDLMCYIESVTFPFYSVTNFEFEIVYPMPRRRKFKTA